MDLKTLALKKRINTKLDNLKEQLKDGSNNHEIGTKFFLEKVYEASCENKVTYIPLEEVSVEAFPNDIGYLKTDGGFLIIQQNEDFLLARGRTTYKINPEDLKKLKKNISIIDKEVKKDKSFDNQENIDKFLEDKKILKQAPYTKTELLELFYEEIIAGSDLKLKEAFIAKFEDREDIVNKKGTITKTNFKKIPLGDFYYLFDTNNIYFEKTQMSKLLNSYKFISNDIVLSLKKNVNIDSSMIENESYKKFFEEIENKLFVLQTKITNTSKELKKIKDNDDLEQSEKINQISQATIKLSSFNQEIKNIANSINNEINEPSPSDYVNIIFQIEQALKTEETKKNCFLTYREKETVEPIESIEPRYTKITLKSEHELFAKSCVKENLEVLHSLNVHTEKVNIISDYGVFSVDGEKPKEKALNNLLLYAKSLLEQQDGKREINNKKELQKQKQIDIF